MKKLLIGLLLVSFMVSAETEVKEEVGRYKIEVTTYTSKKGNVYVLETIFDTKTGKVIDRKRFYHTKYRKNKK
jgi:hypothetical protein